MGLPSFSCRAVLVKGIWFLGNRANVGHRALESPQDKAREAFVRHQQFIIIAAIIVTS